MRKRHRLEEAAGLLDEALGFTGQEFLSELNQVAINIISTGAAAAIAQAVKKYRKRGTRGPTAPHPHSV